MDLPEDYGGMRTCSVAWTLSAQGSVLVVTEDVPTVAVGRTHRVKTGAAVSEGLRTQHSVLVLTGGRAVVTHAVRLDCPVRDVDALVAGDAAAMDAAWVVPTAVYRVRLATPVTAHDYEVPTLLSITAYDEDGQPLPNLGGASRPAAPMSDWYCLNSAEGWVAQSGTPADGGLSFQEVWVRVGPITSVAVDSGTPAPLHGQWLQILAGDGRTVWFAEFGTLIGHCVIPIQGVQ